LNDTNDTAQPLTTRVISPAQVLLCKGCCCGKTERGLPEVPVERIKAVWKAEKLNRAVQLTISGCLGPCDLPNVVLVITGTDMHWYGLIAGDEDYDALIDWARACKETGQNLAPPDLWAARRFERFPEESLKEEVFAVVEQNPGS
jgi:(2Fe-2S) ferredoxin